MTRSPALILLGAGGHAKVLVDALRQVGTPIAFAVDLDSARHGAELMGIRIAGGDEEVFRHAPDTVRLVNGLGSIRAASGRKNLFERFRNKGYRFETVVHTSAIVSPDVELGEGAQVMAGAVIQAGSWIGSNAIVNSGAIVDHDCRVGDHVHIAPGVVLSGGVRVGDCSHVGTGACVIQQIEIGEACTIGAGAVVVRHVASQSTVVGVPAREVSR